MKRFTRLLLSCWCMIAACGAFSLAFRQAAEAGESVPFIRSTAGGRHSGNPVTPPRTQSPYDNYSAREAEIFFARGKWWQFYDGWPDRGTCSVLLRSSKDLTKWTNHGEVIPKDPTDGKWGHGGVGAVGAYYDAKND